ncbi:MAG: aminoacyl-histidine dipeptidase [Bacteroidales bacterium]|nr:aminoacyl-histidine dipeptidase [Bacteroidales bacterium]
MNKELSGLYPGKLWECFASICAIPHPSKHETEILTWLKEWAKENQIECRQDETGNLLMSKPATPGMENRTPIILQGHIDMVPQANSDKKHDFTTDPIEPVIGEDGWVRANGTTLGADNGIGCSAAMALLLSKDVQHGPLEVLITVDEETGMTGAFGLKEGFVKGRILMNLDSEDEGELYVGCAGGMDANIEMDYAVESAAGLKGYEIAVTGLKGGHSGMDINLGRANANKIMVRILKQAEKFGIRIASINGGSLRNAIPREAFGCVGIPLDKTAAFTEFIQQFTAVVAKEFAATEPDMTVQLRERNIENIMEKDAQNRLVNLVYALPHGVMRMSDAMENLVETSTNLAIVKVENGKILVANLLRSSVDSAKESLGLKMTAIAEMAKANISLTGAYPGWKPNMASPVLKTMLQVYQDKFGKKPEVKAIHAGLECGLFGVSYDWDMISFGPTIRNPHSPDERVNIESVGKFWDFLVETVKNVPVYIQKLTTK